MTPKLGDGLASPRKADGAVTRDYWRESDPVLNRHFSWQWTEPQRRRRQQETISRTVRKKPPPDPPDKERPAPVVRISNRPLVQASFKTSTSDYSRQVDKAKASRRARAEAEVLFVQGDGQ